MRWSLALNWLLSLHRDLGLRLKGLRLGLNRILCLPLNRWLRKLLSRLLLIRIVLLISLLVRVITRVLLVILLILLLIPLVRCRSYRHGLRYRICSWLIHVLSSIRSSSSCWLGSWCCRLISYLAIISGCSNSRCSHILCSFSPLWLSGCTIHITGLSMFLHLTMHNLNSASVADDGRIAEGTSRTVSCAVR